MTTTKLERPPGVMTTQEIWDKASCPKEVRRTVKRVLEDWNPFTETLNDLMELINEDLKEVVGDRQAFIDWCEAYGIDTESMKP